MTEYENQACTVKNKGSLLPSIVQRSTQEDLSIIKNIILPRLATILIKYRK